MTLLNRVLFFLLLASPLLMAQGNAKTSTSANTQFARLADQFVKDSLALSPVTASGAGYHEHPDPKTGKPIALDAQLDDVSPQAMTTQQKFYREWRTRFQKETPVSALNPQDAADFRLLDDQIALNLLELDEIQNYKHNPTVYVELIGNAVFLPLTQQYASKDVRLSHILSRIDQIPRFLDQAKAQLVEADPIFISTAIEENEGNIDLINSVEADLPAHLKPQYDKVAPAANQALAAFNEWLKNDLAKRPTGNRTWRLGKVWYDQKFRYVMQTSITPAQLLADAEADMKSVRAEMLDLALPLYRQMYPGQPDDPNLSPRDRENKIIGAVLMKISDDHARRDQLLPAVEADLESIKQFIREKNIVALGSRDNLKVIPTPEFERGIYSVGGFHSAPPLEPNAEAQYWVTPIDPKTPDDKAESKLREYNSYALKWLTIHEALPGHYVQAEHANDVQPAERRVLRNLFGNGPYVEGWAEYIAQVMMDAGYLNHDPKFRLVMRKIRLRVLSNTILDIRMHTMGMTDEQAMDLMKNEAFQTQAEADGKLTRAKLSSTQLPTYYLGIRQWFALRKKYEAARGSTFNLEDFHNRALDQGPLPLEYLEKILLPANP